MYVYVCSVVPSAPLTLLYTAALCTRCALYSVLCVCVSDARARAHAHAHGPRLLLRPGPFCSVRGLRSDGVPGSSSPNELSQLVTTTDAHAHAVWSVVCHSVRQYCRPPSIPLGASWSPLVLRTHNLCRLAARTLGISYRINRINRMASAIA